MTQRRRQLEPAATSSGLCKLGIWVAPRAYTLKRSCLNNVRLATMSRGRAWLEVHMAALASSRSTAEAGTAGWDPQILSTSAPQHTPRPQTGLAGLQGPLQCLPTARSSDSYEASAASRPFLSFFFALGLSGGPQCVSLIWRRDWWEVHWSE